MAESERNPAQDATEAAAHVNNAKEILKALEGTLGQHPEIGAAILKLEMALNVLAVNTGGLL